MKHAMVHDDDLVLYFGASQEERHDAVIRLNAAARALIDTAAVNEASLPEATGKANEVESPPVRFRITLGVDHETLRDKQRRFLHGPVLTQISEQVVSDGTRYVAKVWKEYFRKRLLGSKFEHYRLPGQKRAVPRKVRISTEDLTDKQYAEYTDTVIATATVEFGVTFEFDPIEREGVRYVRKVRAPTKAPEGATA